MTKTAAQNDSKVKKSASSAKANKASSWKDVVIKQEDHSDDEDSMPGALGSLSALIAKAKAGSSASTGPIPGSRDYAVQNCASNGAKVVTPMKAMKAIAKKANTKAAVKIMSFNVFGEEGEADHTFGIAMGGDLFSVRDQIKAVDKMETEVNGVCIPMVDNALPARFISEQHMKGLISASPQGTKPFTSKLSETFQCMWLIIAPKTDEDDQYTDKAAAVSAAVGLDEYSLTWRHALQGKPIHFDEVEHIEYFIGVEELQFLQNMHSSRDPHFGVRSSAIRR